MFSKVRIGLATIVGFVAASALSAQEIDPVDVYQDPNGIDLVSNNVSTPQMPELSIPAAPELTFRDLADFVPLLEVVTGDAPATPFNPNVYTVSAGRVASDVFAQCGIEVCFASNGTGGELFGYEGGDNLPNPPPPQCTGIGCPPPLDDPLTQPGDVIGLGGATYRAGGSGLMMTFIIETGGTSGTVSVPVRKFLATEIVAPGGADLHFEYDSQFIGGIEYHRPSVVTSTSGYQLKFTYHSNSANLNWGSLQKAEIVEASNPTVALASFSYAGNTVTDIDGRVFECVCMPDIYPTRPVDKASRMKLPGETDWAFQTTRQAGSNTRSVTADGVTYSYVSTPDNSWTQPPGLSYPLDAIEDITITGPEGFYQYIDVTNVPATTGQFDPPRRMITSVTDSLGNITTYQYTGTQRLSGATYPEGNSVATTYDVRGNLTSRTDTPKPGSSLQPITQTSAYPTTSCGLAGFDCYKPTWAKDGEGNQTDFTWNGWGLLVTQLDPADQHGKRRKTKNTWSGNTPINGETCPSFTQLGLPGPARCTPRLLKTEICEANSAGVEQTCGTAASFVREFTYVGATSLVASETVTDGAGNGPLTTSYSYDAAGRQLSINPPLAGTDDAAYTRYDNLGRKIWEIGPKGANGKRPASTYTYRAADDQVTEVKTGTVAGNTTNSFPSGNPSLTLIAETDTDYNNRRLATKTTVKNGATYSVTQASYDALNRTDCTATRMNPAVFGSLPSSACSLSTQGADGPDRITKTKYDSEGRVFQIRRGVGTADEISEVMYSYYPNGQIENVVDANGNRAKLRFDGHDRQERWFFPNKTRPANFNKNASSVASAGATTPTWQDFEAYTYDKNGNRLTHRKRDGSTISYQYDKLNRVTKKDLPFRSDLLSVHSNDVFYKYDLRGLQTEARFGSTSGRGVFYNYDRYGRLIQERQNVDRNINRSISSQYDANGNRTRVTHPDNQYWQFEHAGSGAVTKLRQGTWHFGNFVYDSREQLREIDWFAGAASTHKRLFTYDSIGRVQSIQLNLHSTSRDVTWSYTRNSASQIKTEAQTNDVYSWDGQVNLTRNYTTNGLNQYTNAGSSGFSYDANGNLTSDGNRTFKYDSENRLVQAVEGSRVTDLYYDPTGRLYRVWDNQLGQTNFIYDGNALAVEYENTTLARRYVHGSNAEADDPLIWYEGSAVNASTRRFLHADPRGSIVAVASAAGMWTVTNTYDEYGIPDTASGNDISTKGRFRYTGQMWIPELGMYYYKARIYSPTLGRFLQTDPIGYEDQYNLYAYVGNDPINGFDPTGMSCEALDDGDSGAYCDRDNPQDDGPPIVVTGKRPASGITARDVGRFLGRAALELAPGGAAVDCIFISQCDTTDKILAGADLIPGLGKLGKLGKLRKFGRACGCVVAGTLVATPEGLVAIETLQIGDIVLAYDVETGEVKPQSVLNVLQTEPKPTYNVVLRAASGETAQFEATDDHPWLNAAKEWRNTEELTVGDWLIADDGERFEVIEVALSGDIEVAYTLTVDTLHTYIMGEAGIIVHNAKCIKANSPVWKSLKPWRGKTKTDGDKRYEWDHTHGDIEVYDKRGNHLGTMDPESGDMIKGPVNGRTLGSN